MGARRRLELAPGWNRAVAKLVSVVPKTVTEVRIKMSRKIHSTVVIAAEAQEGGQGSKDTLSMTIRKLELKK